MFSDDEDRLRRLALNDEIFIQSILAGGVETLEGSGLDDRTHALVRLSSLLTVGGATSVTHYSAVEHALNAGASPREVVGTLIAIAPIVGFVRVVSAATGVALALGYNVEAALEDLEEE